MNDDKPKISKKTSPLLRLILEAGPLAVFFIANSQFGLFKGTAIFMVATVLSLAIDWKIEHRIPILPLVSGIFVLVFGGLTLYLNDQTFIKIKPTIVNCLFSVLLCGGLLLKRNLIKYVLGESLDLHEDGWRKLSWRWAIFFLIIGKKSKQ